MIAGALSIHDSLASARRFHPAAAAEKPAAWEIAALLGLGVASGLAMSFAKLNLGIPGHAIVLSVLPLGFGVSLVPRRAAASIAGGSAALVMALTAHTGAGAIASMLATGVLLDLALRKARPGLGLYAAFALAGLGGNAVAWIARAAAKLTGVDAGIVSLSRWWGPSLVSYALCGALAGLVSAALWFQFSRKPGARA